jgi:iron complex outermembrane recepter protein
MKSHRHCCALTAAMIVCSPAWAADTPSNATSGAAIPDIVVTARKRSESVQKIPIVMDVVSDRQLAGSGAATIMQLAQIDPSVNIAKAPTGSQIGVTIRGLGSSPGAPSFDSSVSLFEDGLYLPRSREYVSAMFDVQRVEVIKGTQAALLGKNTSLGAIDVITRKPGDTFSIDMRSSYEFERGSTLLSGGVDVPLTDTLKLRLSGQTLNDQGWVYNRLSSDYGPKNRDDAFRGILVWKPRPGIDVTLLGQHEHARNTGSGVEFATLNPLALQLAALAGAPGSLTADFDRTDAMSLTTLGTDQWERITSDRVIGTVNIALGGGTLTSITGYTRYGDNNLSDIDFLPGDYATQSIDEASRQFSQELRFVSDTGHRLDYVVGALYLHNRLISNTTNAANYPFGPAPGLPASYNIVGTERTLFNQGTDTFSAFGQGTVHLGGRLRAIAGLRYTNEHKQVDLARQALAPGLYSAVIFPPYAPFSLARTDRPFDYSFGLQYDLAHTITGYVSYGKGTKSGGFASSATYLDQSEYNRETARTIEAGVKAQDSARRWLLDLSAFHTFVDNFQVVTFNGSAFDVFNTDLASNGFEVQSSWTPWRALRLFLNSTYDDAHDHHTGLAIPLAPRWSGSGGLSVDRPINAAFDFVADGTVNFRSSRTFQQQPATATIGRAFTTLNLDLGVKSADERWDIRLIGRNLANAYGIAFAFPTPTIGTQSVISERSRTIALQVSLHL